MCTPTWLLSEIPCQVFHSRLQTHFFLQGDPLKVSGKACNSSNSSDDILHGHGSQLRTLDRQALWVTTPLLHCSHYTPSPSMSPSGGSWSLCWQIPTLSLNHSVHMPFLFLLQWGSKPPSVTPRDTTLCKLTRQENSKGAGDGNWGERCSQPQSFFI